MSTVAAASAAGSSRHAAQQFVAMTFIQPMLKEVRQSSNAAEPFAPTQGERMFGSMLDEKIAQNIVNASDWSLVDRIESDLLRRGKARIPTAPPPPTPTLDLPLAQTLSFGVSA